MCCESIAISLTSTRARSICMGSHSVNRQTWNSRLYPGQLRLVLDLASWPEQCMYELEGAQRVYISTKYTIMLWCTRLHVYISTSLVMYLRSRRLPNDVIDNDGVLWRHWHVRKIHRKRCWHFCTFLHNPHVHFEPDYVARKPRKWRFQRYIGRTEIFSTFHTRIEYISVKTVISVYQCRAAMMPQSIYRLFTDWRKEIKASHDIHQFTPFTWRI